MEVEYAKRGVANAGLTTGIIGTAFAFRKKLWK